MKAISVLLILGLLLCGCADRQNPSFSISSLTHSGNLSEAPEAAVPEPLPEQTASGTVSVFPLAFSQVTGMRMLGRDILLFSGTDQTTLTLLNAQTLQPEASICLEHPLDPDDSSIRFHGENFSCFPAGSDWILILDTGLNVVRRIPAPPGLQGTPILSEDLETLYYCTEAAVMAWDLNQDLHRTVKQMRYCEQSLTGLLRQDSVLQCRILDEGRTETLFLSAQQGRILESQPEQILLTEGSGRFYAVLARGRSQALLFGQSPAAVHQLLPDSSGSCTFLETHHAAVLQSPPDNGSVSLQYYDLDTGSPTAGLVLPKDRTPFRIEDAPDGSVWLLVRQPGADAVSLCRWILPAQASPPQRSYTCPYHPTSQPDLAGLERVSLYARELSRKYGISFLVWTDAVATEPWDYDLTPETDPALLKQSLEQLDRQLARYPRQILDQTAGHFGTLSVCLVRRITGTAESGSLDTASGIQFLTDAGAFVVLTPGPELAQTLSHELFHVMETHIWGNSIAFDQWDAVNPAGFRYDYHYETNRSRDSGVYLQPENRAFVDTYSMSFPKEDRARVLEYAMLPEKESLFSSTILQRKLYLLCQGIREAYDLESNPEVFPWEQYLQ